MNHLTKSRKSIPTHAATLSRPDYMWRATLVQVHHRRCHRPGWPSGGRGHPWPCGNCGGANCCGGMCGKYGDSCTCPPNGCGGGSWGGLGGAGRGHCGGGHGSGCCDDGKAGSEVLGTKTVALGLSRESLAGGGSSDRGADGAGGLAALAVAASALVEAASITFLRLALRAAA